MARRFQSRSRNQSQRRLTDWIGGTVTTSVRTTVGASTVVAIKSFDTRTSGQTPAAPFTIVRVRGILSVSLLSPTGNDDAQGAYGMCIINGEAFDAGVASMISPYVESFDDRWFYHTFWSVQTELIIAGQASTEKYYDEVIDSKSMRKVEHGDVIVSICENANSGNNVSVFQNDRILVKVH